jgi:hypothetical protein
MHAMSKGGPRSVVAAQPQQFLTRSKGGQEQRQTTSLVVCICSNAIVWRFWAGALLPPRRRRGNSPFHKGSGRRPPAPGDFAATAAFFAPDARRCRRICGRVAGLGDRAACLSADYTDDADGHGSAGGSPARRPLLEGHAPSWPCRPSALRSSERNADHLIG